MVPLAGLPLAPGPLLPLRSVRAALAVPRAEPPLVRGLLLPLQSVRAALVVPRAEPPLVRGLLLPLGREEPRAAVAVPHVLVSVLPCRY